MVNAQVIILVIAVIGFFATGGIGKTKTALAIARTDFEVVRGRTTDFVNSIKEKSLAGKEGKEA